MSQWPVANGAESKPMKNVMPKRKLGLRAETVVHLKQLPASDLRQVKGGDSGFCTKTRDDQEGG